MTIGGWVFFALFVILIAGIGILNKTGKNELPNAH